jgi:hypothetical protein
LGYAAVVCPYTVAAFALYCNDARGWCMQASCSEGGVTVPTVWSCSG